jgi:septal ring factor EnvC (AmiA/AmiB activator)
MLEQEMYRRPKYPLALLALLLAGQGLGSAVAPDSAAAKGKLAAVRARMTELAARLGRDLAERDAQGARLRAAELAVTAARGRLDGLRAAQLAAERRGAELGVNQARNQAALEAERAALASQIRAAYMIGNQERIKMLLSQRDPAALGRMLAYYGYFGRLRAGELEAIRARLARLESLAADIARQTATLKALQADARRELKALEDARAERARALAAVNLEVSNGSQELARLKREEAAEESLLIEIERVMQDFPVGEQPFEQLRGRLPWPVAGRLAARYHEPRADSPQSGLRWNGVLIETARGAKVRSPYYGRVVYADWLQGLGLLLIIGHSGGYMSLYGHAEVLYKSIGDSVAPGDVIAAMSDADGTPPQLYFEIRQGRKPEDPGDWLKRAP